MKIALVHDFLVEYGGAERVLETLKEMFPQAPVYVALYDPRGPGMKRFKDWEIKTSRLQKLPFSRFLLSPLRIFALKFFECFDLKDYDLIISSTWMYMAKGVKKRKDALHLCYLHTPPRFLYGYPTARNWQKYWWGRLIGGLMNHFLRKIDFQASQRPDILIANSEFTARRIKKFYRRKSVVIYPPVEVKAKIKPEKGQYFLCVSRLARAKRIDLAIQACNQLNLPLVVVGAGHEEKYLKSIAGRNVKFLGHLTDNQLAKVYSQSKALIFPAEAEDFGIVPVEAMSFGKPVIALKSGGVKETVIEGKAGLFFDQPTVKSLKQALIKFEKLDFKNKDCLEQAENFSQEKFKKQIKDLIKLKE